MPANLHPFSRPQLPLLVQGPAGWGGMIAPPPRIWPAPPPAHVNGTSAASRYGYSSLAQILPSPQDKGDDQPHQQQPAAPVYAEEPIKLRKETKHSTTTTEWRRPKDRARVKLEPGLTPCQVQEITTSSKHEQSSAGGIPVGIAVARQRVQQQSTPPPLTVLTCEERSTNQVTGWTGPPPHWHYPGVEQSLPLQVPPLQLGRDPISGQLLLLPSPNLGDSMQRAVLWPSSTGTSNSSAPPPLVMPGTQPVLLDRFVTLAPPSAAASPHHHQDKRRSHDHSQSIHGGSTGGLAVGLFPPPPPQAPFLMMPFSHQNNSLLLSTQLTEHNLNTMVVTNHQLSESAVLSPMEVIPSPVEGFGGGSMIQQLPPSVVISHTETNSFVRSDINAVYPAQPQPLPHSHLQDQVIIKEEIQLAEEPADEECIEEETKTEVMDASNQTESGAEESETENTPMPEREGELTVKTEAETEEETPPSAPPISPPPQQSAVPQEPDMSGLQLLLSSIAQYEGTTAISSPASPPLFQSSSQMKEEKRDDWSEESQSISSGLGLLCSVAERCLEEVVVEKNTVVPEDNKEMDVDQVEKSQGSKILEVDELELKSEEIVRGTVKNEREATGEEWASQAVSETQPAPVKTKRGPGRPKKKSRKDSPTRREPPVLQPWSASPGGNKSPLRSPPTLTPHKRKLSHDMSQESDESSSSSGHPPPLSPACTTSNSSKKRKVGRPRKNDSKSPEKSLNKTLSPKKDIVDLLMANNLQDHQQTTGSHKIKPKLKAEAKVKDWCDDEELDLSPGKENELDDPLLPPSVAWQSPPKSKIQPLSPPRKPKVKIMEEIKKEEEPAMKSPSQVVVKSPKAPQPMAKPSQPVAKPPQLAAKPPQLEAKVPLPVAKPPLPVAKPPLPVDKPILPVAKPPPQIAKPPQQLAKPSQQEIKPSQPVAKPPQSVTKPPPLVTKPLQPVAKPPQPVTKPPQPVTKPPQPVTKPPLPVAKSPQPVAKPPQTVAKPSQPLSKSPQPLSKPAKPSQRSPTSQRPGAPHRTPATHRTTLPLRPSSPIAPPSSPHSESLQRIPDCKLTEEQLKSLPCRILSITDGQFYPGEVTKIIAPDIYEVHIYKERCRKPQILCRDEILFSSVAEVHCPEDMFIPSGTRVCAYWSQQYSCFYPGRVVADSHAGQVPIDFDDGDNGTIERTSIRFLPQDYPIVEQPPNPLIGKRKRYNSTTSSDSHKINDSVEVENGHTSSTDLEEKLGNITKCGSETKEDVGTNADKENQLSPESVDDEKSSFDESKSEESDEQSSSKEMAACDSIASVLEGFFRSEEEERQRQSEIKRRRHRHHRHRESCKTHKFKCKHKHHRSHKHKHSRDESRKSDVHNNLLNGGKVNGESNGCSSGGSSSLEQGEKNPPDEEQKKIEGSVSLANKSKSKIAAFLPEKHEMWSWVGAGVKRGRALGPRGKGLKMFYKAIKRGPEVIRLGDCAVFVSTGRPDRPFIGQIESFWQCLMKKNMIVKVAWFYHPEETIGCPERLPYPGGLFRSPHMDNNDVQTISHRCEVLSLAAFRQKAEKEAGFLDTVYENNETYYLAGHYQPAGTSLTLEPGMRQLEEEGDGN